MRAVVDAVEMCVLLPERLLHPIMDIPQLRFLDQPPPHSGLVGDNDGQQAGLVDLEHRLEAVGIDLDQVKGAGISYVPVDVPIPIQENGRLLHASHLWLTAKTSSGEMDSMQR